MTVEILSGIVGVVISLVFSYFPGLKEKYAVLPREQKSLWMLGTMVTVTLAVFGLTCGGLAADLGWVLTCDKSGALTLAKIFGAMLVANQSAFLISPTK